MSSAASSAGSTNLLTPLTPLVGREREMAALVDLQLAGSDEIPPASEGHIFTMRGH